MSTKIDHFDLSGRKAMVVGVENPAGAAIARAYAEAGADVALCVLKADDAVMTAKRIQKEIEAQGSRSGVYVMDVTLGRNVQVTTRQVTVEAFPAEWSACRIISASIARTCSSDGSVPVIMRSIIAACDSPARGPSYGRPSTACAMTPTRCPTRATSVMPRCSISSTC